MTQQYDLDVSKAMTEDVLAGHLWNQQDSRDWAMMVRYVSQYPVSEQAREVATMRQTARRAVDFLMKAENKKVAMIIELKNQLRHNNEKLETGSANMVLVRAEAFLKELGL